MNGPITQNVVCWAGAVGLEDLMVVIYIYGYILP